MTVVVLSPELRARLVAWSRMRSPREACGVLVGQRASTRAHACDVPRDVVHEIVESPNRASGEAEFAIDPGAIVEIDASARGRGLEIVGFWHSHVEGPAIPSTRDLAHGAWPGYALVVVGVQANAMVRAWHVGDGALIESVVADEPLATLPS